MNFDEVVGEIIEGYRSRCRTDGNGRVIRAGIKRATRPVTLELFTSKSLTVSPHRRTILPFSTAAETPPLAASRARFTFYQR
jgi:hypothetical protein